MIKDADQWQNNHKGISQGRNLTDKMKSQTVKVEFKDKT